MADYAKLPPLLDQAGSSIGQIIRLGKEFVDRGIDEMDTVVKPLLVPLLGGCVIPRIISSYTIFLWFAFEVLFQQIY